MLRQIMDSHYEQGAWRTGWLDRLAMTLSGLCVVHCVSTAVFVAVFASVGGILLSPVIHETGLVLATVFAALGLGSGALRHGMFLPASVGGMGIGIMAGAITLPHGGYETLATIFGVAIVALGHDLNRRALI